MGKKVNVSKIAAATRNVGNEPPTPEPCPLRLVIGLFFDGTDNYRERDIGRREADDTWFSGTAPLLPALRDRITTLHADLVAATGKQEDFGDKAARLERDAIAARQEEQQTGQRWRALQRMSRGATSRQAAALQKARETYLNAARRAAMLDSEATSLRQRAADMEAAAQRAKKRYDEACRRLFRSSPAESGPTNVVHLHDTYQEKDNFIITEDGVQQGAMETVIRREYIRGVGAGSNLLSHAGGITGRAFGILVEGAADRITDAQNKTNALLGRYLPTEVVFDVFGFSRGAALARHFCNLLLQNGVPDFRKKPTLVSQPVGASGNHAAFTRVYPSLPLRIRFLGLFDTVGSFYLPGNAAEGEIITGLPAGNNGEGRPEPLQTTVSGGMGTVVHYVARHERRHNFRHTDARGAGTEAVMDGAHSDIGGGYRMLEFTELPVDCAMYTLAKFSFGGAIEKAEQELMARAAKKGLVAGGQLPPGWRIRHITLPVAAQGATFRIAYLMRPKLTWNTLAKTALGNMYEAAKAANVPLGKLDTNAYPVVGADMKQLLPWYPPGADMQWESEIHVSAASMEPVTPYAVLSLTRYEGLVDSLSFKPDELQGYSQGRYGFANGCDASAAPILHAECAVPYDAVIQGEKVEVK